MAGTSDKICKKYIISPEQLPRSKYFLDLMVSEFLLSQPCQLTVYPKLNQNWHKIEQIEGKMHKIENRHHFKTNWAYILADLAAIYHDLFSKHLLDFTQSETLIYKQIWRPLR